MSALAERVHCPDCGTELGSDGASAGLCPRCLLSLALVRSRLEPTTEVDSEAPTLERPAAGRILGERYQMREMLGRGGMGEVWRAFDLKLRVDVALKSVRPERLESEKARDLLRQEVRSAREVVSPNVCRIFDLVEEDGRELVSMEYIDGTTLSETLRERGPLELQDAREIASQFLSGLESIHQAGLVHRDFKPENVMLTRAGRVVVMDFGLARGLTERGTGTVAGTPAYMAPEQSRGDTLDARADVFAAGVVLAEMLTVGGEEALAERRALWKAVRERPPQVPDGPWAAVLRQALDPAPETRPESARALARALEEVTLRLPGFEEKRPYPGLASFTEEDADYFFGREAEVEAVWKKLKRPRLLALIGPSGTGKSSFIRAGLLPTLPPGWDAVVATPGHRPFQALAQALVPELSGDDDAMQELLRFEEADVAVNVVSRWRRRHEHALIVVDQFEELFTLASPETQAAFAELLARLVLEADVHVLLSLRDDFLFQCTAHEPLGPAFADLTPLASLGDSALRRALVQPALACGYRFEDEALVEEMIGDVSRERGALPLLAFAASRLWEERDREQGLLTRAAYQEIGGVAGALAQHAEATLERIGAHRTPLVRELFRNLVTAQGTRAVRERGELLSVFEETSRADADEVLAALVDARLLTSFERSGEDGGENRHEVEIIHESLLSCWPRLVRWQTQDAEGAQVRDQLRQAARLWEERGRPEDLLWTGMSFRELALWRERYPGGLSASEEDFASAMTRHAHRRRRRRRWAVTAVITALTLGLGTVGGLWRRAVSETRRAQAARVVTRGEVELESDPTAAAAFAIRSLELADTREGRLLALAALQRGPLALKLDSWTEDGLEALALAISPDGGRIAIGGFKRAQVRFADNRPRLVLDEREEEGIVGVAFPSGEVLATHKRGLTRGWSLADGVSLWESRAPYGLSGFRLRGNGFYSATTVGEGPEEELRRVPGEGGEPRLLGRLPGYVYDVDPGERWMAHAEGRRVLVRPLGEWDSRPRVVGEHSAAVRRVSFDGEGGRVAALDSSGEIRVWSVGASSPGDPRETLQVDGARDLRFAGDGSRVVIAGTPGGHPRFWLWDLEGPPAATPLVLRAVTRYLNQWVLHPGGDWLVSNHANQTFFWPLVGDHPRVLAVHQGPVNDVAFSRDGRSVVSASADGTVRVSPLSRAAGAEGRVLLREQGGWSRVQVARSADRVVAAQGDGSPIAVVPLPGGPAQELTGFSPGAVFHRGVGIRDDGRLVAAAPVRGPMEDKVVRVWDLESGDVRVFPVPGAGPVFEGGVSHLQFVGEDQILTCGIGGVALLDLASGTSRVQSSSEDCFFLAVAPDGRSYVSTLGDFRSKDSFHRAVLTSLDDGVTTELSPSGSRPFGIALDAAGRTLVTRDDFSGDIRVGPLGEGEPHLLLSQSEAGKAGQETVAISPDGRWVASGERDGTVWLWPVPDPAKTPFHTLPHDELMKTLGAVTNVRVVETPGTSTGFETAPGPFPGWAEVPQW